MIPWWKVGGSTEADFLLKKITNAVYLIYPVDKENVSSRRIPEKLGFFVFAEYKKAKDENTFLHIIEYRKYYNI